MSDAELNKAALLIAKLLVRTREGKVHWEHSLEREIPQNFFAADLTSCRFFKAPLESGLEAVVGEDSELLGFELVGVSPQGERQVVVQVLLPHIHGKGEQVSPEAVVYGDIKDILSLAEHPKMISDDLQFKQAMSYLDRLTA